MYIGILLAFSAFIFWGLGDFLIQRSTRTVGEAQTLLTIGLISTPLLLPIIYKDLISLTPLEHLTLLTMSVLVVVYAITLFKAFDVGKLSVVESVMILELPLAVGMSVIWLGDRLDMTQMMLFLIICGGVALATVKDIHHLNYSKHVVEKGVWLAFAGAGLAAAVDVFISSSAQSISPLIALWYQHAFIVIVFGIYLTFIKGWSEFLVDIKTHPFLMLGQGVCDNIAWLSFVFAVNYISTSLVMSISEGYIIIAVLLGHFLNKETLKMHQVIGISLAVPAMLLLAYLSS